MLILMMVQMRSEEYDEIVAKDMHPDDIADLITQLAAEDCLDESPEMIWHIREDKRIELIRTLNGFVEGIK